MGDMTAIVNEKKWPSAGRDSLVAPKPFCQGTRQQAVCTQRARMWRIGLTRVISSKCADVGPADGSLVPRAAKKPSASSTRRTNPSARVTEPESTFFFDASDGSPNEFEIFFSCSTRGLTISASCSMVVPSRWPEKCW